MQILFVPERSRYKYKIQQQYQRRSLDRLQNTIWRSPDKAVVNAVQHTVIGLHSGKTWSSRTLIIFYWTGLSHETVFWRISFVHVGLLFSYCLICVGSFSAESDYSGNILGRFFPIKWYQSNNSRMENRIIEGKSVENAWIWTLPEQYFIFSSGFVLSWCWSANSVICCVLNTVCLITVLSYVLPPHCHFYGFEYPFDIFPKHFFIFKMCRDIDL